MKDKAYTQAQRLDLINNVALQMAKETLAIPPEMSWNFSFEKRKEFPAKRLQSAKKILFNRLLFFRENWKKKIILRCKTRVFLYSRDRYVD